jgi:hypothetical protein
MRLIHLIAVEDPSQTHHWLLPETAEIIYGGSASLIIFAAIYKFGLPAAKKALNARTERIQKELDGAANALSQATQDAHTTTNRSSCSSPCASFLSQRRGGRHARNLPSRP